MFDYEDEYTAFCIQEQRKGLEGRVQRIVYESGDTKSHAQYVFKIFADSPDEMMIHLRECGVCGLDEPVVEKLNEWFDTLE